MALNQARFLFTASLVLIALPFGNAQSTPLARDYESDCEDRSIESSRLITPEIADQMAIEGTVEVAESIRLIPGAKYHNSFKIIGSNISLFGDILNPPMIIPPIGTKGRRYYGVTAKNVSCVKVVGLKIQTQTFGEDNWVWHAPSIVFLRSNPKYGGILFESSKNNVIEDVQIADSEGNVDALTRRGGFSGFTLVDTEDTLILNSKSNSTIFGLVISGGGKNVVLDSTFRENWRQGVNHLGDGCDGCEASSIAIHQSGENFIGLPGHGNTLLGSNGIFIFWTEDDLSKDNEIIENHITAGHNGIEAVRTRILAVNNIVIGDNRTGQSPFGIWATGGHVRINQSYVQQMPNLKGSALQGQGPSQQLVVLDMLTKDLEGNPAPLFGTWEIISDNYSPDLSRLSPSSQKYLRRYLKDTRSGIQ